ncbi:hypothetical protein BH11ACT8_BH11ACT8_07450 [soil metagenome]
MTDERYGLTWPGKRDAVRSVDTPSRQVLVPDRERSVAFDTAENVVVEGDNLEALKLLQATYAARVKLVYIDPPYNTGGDEFVYPDDFAEPLRAYLERTGQSRAPGDTATSHLDQAGRRHSRWLSMMYPRLALARTLLRPDGALCVSIDANEDFNLRALLDEIFGPANFVAQLVVVRAEGGGLAEQVVQGHDLLLVYARDRAQFTPLRRPKAFRGRLVEHEGAEHWVEEDWLRKEFGAYGTCHYEEILEVKGRATLEEVDARLATGQYQLRRMRNGMHVVGRLRPTATDGSKFYSVVKHLSRDGKRRLGELGLAGVFEFPKPVSLVQSLVLGATFGTAEAGDVILDFFAGSGTTADAVLQQNAADGGNRRFVLVTYPEPISERSVAGRAGFATIAEVTLARVRAAMAEVDGGERHGLRVYSLRPIA